MTFTVRHGFSMALIEIDGLPIINAGFPYVTYGLPIINAGFPYVTYGGSFHGELLVSHNQMVYYWGDGTSTRMSPQLWRFLQGEMGKLPA